MGSRVVVAAWRRAIIAAVETGIAAVAATIATITTAVACAITATLWFADLRAWLVAFYNGFIDRLLGETLDIANLETITETRERDGETLTTGATGAANAMDVVFRFHRQTVVDDVRNARNVDTASGNVGGDQNFGGAITQRFEATVTHNLWHRAVKASSRIARFAKLVSQFVGFDLRRSEDDGLTHRFVLQVVLEQFVLVRHVVEPMQTLLNVLVRVLRGGELDTLWIAHHVGRELHDAWRESGAKHQRTLATCGRSVNRFEIFRETKVEHAVGFVNDQRLHAVEIDLTIAVQVEQTARRCNDEIRAAQFHELFAEWCATYDVGDTDTAAEADEADRFRTDLLREFARRAKHQHTWASASATAASGLLAFRHGRRFEQRVQRGQQEGGSFTATCLRRNHPVAASECCGNGFGLNAGRLRVAEGLHGLQQRRVQIQRGKAVGFVRRFSGRGFDEAAVGADVVRREIGNKLGILGGVSVFRFQSRFEGCVFVMQIHMLSRCAIKHIRDLYIF